MLPDQSAVNTPAIGIERNENDPLNVVVSGWVIYNNKGNVVEQYETFFDKGFDYSLPQLSTIGGVLAPQLGIKIKTYYDPLDRVIRIVAPDRSEQRIIYGVPNELSTPNQFSPTPWENYSYDANDLSPITNPINNPVPESHWYTPTSNLTDSLGRTILTIDHRAFYDSNSEQYENVVTKFVYNIQGDVLEAVDANNRVVYKNKYDLNRQLLWSNQIDNGKTNSLFDAEGKLIESYDSKKARSLTAYDRLQRPTNGWSQNDDDDTLRLIDYFVYGEQATNPETNNLLGQLWQQYDGAGKIESAAFDFKGNLLSKKQQVIASPILKGSLDNYETYFVDWTSVPNILDSKIFETNNELDALNRITLITLPEDVNGNRKQIIPGYNNAGALKTVEYDGIEYVENIAYNAKGQRILISYGNSVMTRYIYDDSTFRLIRQRSEKFIKTDTGSTVSYIPQSGTNKQDDAFNFDLVGNMLKMLHRVTDCGISGSVLGSDALNRHFEYDPLYRLTSADGRESDTQHENDYLYNDAPTPGSPNASNVREYTRKYSYDKLGNILQVKQLGTNGFTRNFTYNNGKNGLQKVETSTPTLIQDFTYDDCGNQTKAGTNRNYVWNAGNQLVTYFNQAGTADPTIFAQYDYSGMARVSKLVRTGTNVNPIYERTIYIDGFFEYCILENGTTYEKNYVHVMDDSSRIVMIRIGDAFPDDISDSVTYNLEDQIGGSVARLDTNGTVIDREEYYPFGDSSLRTFTKKRYRFTGKEKDLESGLYYYGARYYLPWTCRFISADPISDTQPEKSSYHYCSNNPITRIDPSGLTDNEGNYYTQDGTHLGDDGINDGRVFYIDKQNWNDAKYQLGNVKGDSFQANLIYRGAREVHDVREKYTLAHLAEIKAGRAEYIRHYKNNLSKARKPEPSRAYKKPVPVKVPEGTPVMKTAPRDEPTAWQVKYFTGQQEAKRQMGLMPGFDQFQKIGNGLEVGAPIALMAVGQEWALARLTNSIRLWKATNTVATTINTGGRLGNLATRTQISEIATTLESRGYTITGGGGRLPEEFLKPLGTGRSGGSYLDLTATHPEYGTLRINTVDVYKSGAITSRELTNAARIRTQIGTGNHLLLIKKGM